jgi:transposase
MTRLGLPQSDDTILRNLKRHAADRRAGATVRVVGIDDWSWRKGSSYGTIIVDLERREVVDVLSDRSAEATARWLSQHTKVEIVSRDRCGLYAEGTLRGKRRVPALAPCHQRRRSQYRPCALPIGSDREGVWVTWSFVAAP